MDRAATPNPRPLAGGLRAAQALGGDLGEHPARRVHGTAPGEEEQRHGVL